MVSNLPPAFKCNARVRRYLAASPAVCVSLRERSARVRRLLSTTAHNGFPVVDGEGRLVGLILRSQLSVLLHAEEHAAGRWCKFDPSVDP